MTVRSALIAGAGICGLGVGIALARRGIETQVLEIRPAANVFGVGINQPGNSLRAMQSLGIFEEVQARGFEIDRREHFDPQGNLLASAPIHLASEGVPHAVGIARPELHRILIAAAEDEGVEIRFGTAITEFQEDDEGVHVVLTDGSEQTFDLLVGAEGVNSDTRQRLFGDRVTPEFTGGGVWRLTVPRPDSVDSVGMYYGVTGKAGYIPLSQDTMYLLLGRPEAYRVRFAQQEMPGLLRDRLQEFGGLIAEIREAIRDDDDVIYGPLYEVRMPPPWSKGRVVVCGDAAHSCTPHMTQGAGMAFEDAVVLADELDSDRAVADSLIAFAGRRYPRTKFVQDTSRSRLEAERSLTPENCQTVYRAVRDNVVEESARIDAVVAEAP